jgi:tRNA threonylcarbamoyladenosine biosynthesis protein TsaB
LKLLAIETSSESCSAALYSDGEIRDRHELAPRRHAELILPMVDQLLAEMQISLGTLDTLAFGRGPGSFTGVRIGAGVIQGLAFAADLPVVPVSSLAALAQGAIRDSATILSAIDARMDEIYWGLYRVSDHNVVVPLNQEQVAKPELIKVPAGIHCFGVGSGWRRYPELLGLSLDEWLMGFDGDRYPLAADMVPLALRDFALGLAVSADLALPVYLRNEVTG